MLNREARRTVCRRARQLRPKGMRHAVNRKAWLIYVLIYAPAAALYSILLIDTMRHHQRPSDTMFFGMLSIALTAMWLGKAYSRGKTHAPYVCRALREFGYDVCPDCGYLLRGLSDDINRCPECGWTRENVAFANHSSSTSTLR